MARTTRETIDRYLTDSRFSLASVLEQDDDDRSSLRISHAYQSINAIGCGRI